MRGLKKMPCCHFEKIKYISRHECKHFQGYEYKELHFLAKCDVNGLVEPDHCMPMHCRVWINEKDE